MGKEKTAINNSSFYYSLNLLNNLLKMNLISEEEYIRIVHISAEYYEVKFYCV